MSAFSPTVLKLQPPALSHVTACYVPEMLNVKLSVAFVAWAATTFLAHFSVKQILTTVAPAGIEVTASTVTLTVNHPYPLSP